MVYILLVRINHVVRRLDEDWSGRTCCKMVYISLVKNHVVRRFVAEWLGQTCSSTMVVIVLVIG